MKKYSIILWSVAAINFVVLTAAISTYIYYAFEEYFPIDSLRTLWILTLPALNVLGTAQIFHWSVRLSFATIAVFTNLMAILLMSLMIVWPMGNLGQGFSLVAFWSLYSIAILTELTLFFHIVLIIKRQLKQKR